MPWVSFVVTGLFKVHQKWKTSQKCTIAAYYSKFYALQHTVIQWWLLVYLNPTLHWEWLTWVWVSGFLHHLLASRPACVLINLCQFICMWACTCVSKGWDRQRREQRLPVPEVRSACCHDTLPFTGTPAANTHTQNSLVAPAATPTPPAADVDIYWQNAPSVLRQNVTPVLWSGLNYWMTSSRSDG